MRSTNRKTLPSVSNMIELFKYLSENRRIFSKKKIATAESLKNTGQFCVTSRHTKLSLNNQSADLLCWKDMQMQSYYFLCCFLNTFPSVSQLELHLAMQIEAEWSSEFDSKEKKHQLFSEELYPLPPGLSFVPLTFLSKYISGTSQLLSHLQQEVVCTVTGLELHKRRFSNQNCMGVRLLIRGDGHCTACQTLQQLQSSALFSHINIASLSICSRARWQHLWNS